jgi:adenylyltransferase/sulfurtransferase
MEQKLSVDEILRYGRHLKIPEIGLEGQLKLRSASVVIVGAGGLGSPAALYLVAAGIGRLSLVDFDVVELANVQRQVLHWTPDVGRAKLESAAEKLRAVNPEIRLIGHESKLTADNARELLAGHDAVIDGTDNYEARYVISDACASCGIPHVYGAVFGFEGRIAVFDAARGPCYRCLHPTPPPAGEIPDCAEGGVLGPVPGVVGSLQAIETIKIIAGCGAPLVGRLLLIDTLAMKYRTLEVRRDPACPNCTTSA